jgi:ankyrin repeat protein
MDDTADDGLPSYMTPFYLAVTEHDFGQAQALVAAGNSVDGEPTWDGYTLLHWAADHGNLEATRFLLTAGCARALNTFDYISHTPLIWAAEKGRWEIAQLLIEAGANVNANDEERIGNTAIREATRLGDQRMVELLLAAGADPTIPGWMQLNAVHQAEIRLEKDPTSEVRKQILALLKSHAPESKA